MANTELKQSVVETIKQNIEGATSVVLVDYRGLTVEQDTVLRKNLREANVTYKVYKNTLMRRAFEGTDFAKLDEQLSGPSAIAISYEDATAGPRVLKNMAKDMKALEFKGGVVEGDLFDADGIMKIASIPSRNELLSKLLGSFKSPVSSFARTIKALADKMAEEGQATAAEVAAGVVKEAPAVETVVVEEVVETVAEATTEE